MKALILVDLQNDFMPGGALAVPQGDKVIDIANRLMPLFPRVIASQDWHPPDHGSFVSQHPDRRVGDTIELAGLSQIVWPVHCVQNTSGAQFHPQLNRERIDHVVRKGTDPQADSYSTFFDNAQRRSTGLTDYLRDCGVNVVAIMGLATDYCVKFSALDAHRLGFQVEVIEDGCRGVNLTPNDSQSALEQMQETGITVQRAVNVFIEPCSTSP